MDTAPKTAGRSAGEKPKLAPSQTPARIVSSKVFSAINLCLLVALGGAGYLAVVSLSNGGVAGCGPESGCNRVMSSPWAYWLGFPVSIPAFVVYLSLLTATWGLWKARSVEAQLRCRRIIIAIAPVVLGAALWFFFLQVAVIHAWCKFCLATHIAGSIAAALLLLIASRSGVWQKVNASSSADDGLEMSLMCAALALAGLVGGQIMVKQRLYRIDLFSGHSRLSRGVLSLHDGEIKLDPANLPLLGSSSASNFVVSLFDYTCKHCRALHPILKQVEERYSGRLGIISLPAPLDAACNRLIMVTNPANQNACEYAKLGLAVWRARREAFREFDDWMFASERPPSLEGARAQAQTLVGKEALDRSLSDGWVAAQLQTDIRLYVANSRAIHDARLPQLVVGDVITHGTMQRLDELLELLKKNLRLGEPSPAQP